MKREEGRQIGEETKGRRERKERGKGEEKR